MREKGKYDVDFEQRGRGDSAFVVLDILTAGSYIGKDHKIELLVPL